MKEQTQTIKPTQEEKAAYLSCHIFSAKIEYTDPVGDIETGKLCGINRVMFPGKTYFASVYWNGSKFDVDISKYHSVLLLTPLSDITDEDYHELQIIEDVFEPSEDSSLHMDNDFGSCYFQNQWEGGDFRRPLLLRSYQYLQSKGYALPWRGYTVEQLISFGWLKLRQKGGSNA